jgi:adenosylmethionine-8-amino-7-oxononanoate aminotransferase
MAPYTQMKTVQPPVPIVRGEGACLYDEDGKKYIDAVSSWWVNIHGHAHPYIAKKVAEQLTKLEHVIFAGFTHPTAVELAERLLAILPNNQQKAFYSDNGSTATEVAIKCACSIGTTRETSALKYWHLKMLTTAIPLAQWPLAAAAHLPRLLIRYLFEVEFIDLPK